jgi:hypothetical protein
MTRIFAPGPGHADAIATHRRKAHAGTCGKAFDFAAQRAGAARFVRGPNRLSASFLHGSI